MSYYISDTMSICSDPYIPSNLIGVFAGHMHRWQLAQGRGFPEVTATGAMFGDCLKVEVS